jgi:hypothetical protein
MELRARLIRFSVVVGGVERFDLPWVEHRLEAGGSAACALADRSLHAIDREARAREIAVAGGTAGSSDRFRLRKAMGATLVEIQADSGRDPAENRTREARLTVAVARPVSPFREPLHPRS